MVDWISVQSKCLPKPKILSPLIVKHPLQLYMSVVKLKPNGKATFPCHKYHKIITWLHYIIAKD